MPWVNQSLCTGCGACVDECPVQAISLVNGVALIDDENCIRCGRCHDVCPEGGVRHDSERIPQEVEANMQWVEGLLSHFDTEQERAALLERLSKYFNMRMKVLEESVERLRSLQ